MTITLSIKKQTRVVPVRFERASMGAPDIQFPAIDNRGFNNRISNIDNLPESEVLGSAALSLAENATVTIKLIRENIAPTAALFISCSNTQALKIIAPQAGSKCADGPVSLIKIQSLACTNNQSKSANIEVRFGSNDGPIISKLSVIVLPKLVVKVQPYLVSIGSENGQTGQSPSINIDAALTMTNAIWYHCGIELSVAKPVSLNASLHKTNILSCNQQRNELDKLCNLKWEADRINMYFVRQIEGASCYSINAHEYKHLGLSRPGIFFAQLAQPDNKPQAEDRAADIHLCANEIAHALGSFFTIDEINAESSKNDAWSMACLMFNESIISRGKAPSATWQNYHQFGFGTKGPEQGYRGALIPLKSLNGHHHSSKQHSDLIQARKFISKGAKHLYS